MITYKLVLLNEEKVLLDDTVVFKSIEGMEHMLIVQPSVKMPEKESRQLRHRLSSNQFMDAIKEAGYDRFIFIVNPDVKFLRLEKVDGP